nr:MAG TPA: hypothetical protein [Caudoviricetes sp.]
MLLIISFYTLFLYPYHLKLSRMIVVILNHNIRLEPLKTNRNSA